MLDSRLQIPVIVAEPDFNLQMRFTQLCARIWDESEVLPRSNGKELKTAINWLNCNIVLVRSSSLRSDPSLSNSVIELVCRGAHLICIQDCDTEFSLLSNWLTLNKMHFLSYSAKTGVLEDLLLRCRLNMIANGELAPTDSVD